MYNKYLKLAKEASSTGDRIQSEYYYQFTDHYHRLMLELGISLEENDGQDSKASEDSSETNIANTEVINSLNEKKVEKNNDISETSDEDIESIESVPFISEPVKKKPTRTKKVSA